MEILNDKQLILNSGVQIHIDYLSFTFPMDYDPDIHVDLIDAFEQYKQDLCNLFWLDIDSYGDIRQYKQDGYENQLTLGQNIRIRFGGETTMMKKMLDVDNNIKSDERYYSCMVELKGQGCREIEFNASGTINYLEIFKYFLYERKGKCTRIDIAIDDMDGSIIKLKDIVKIVRKKEYTSCFRVNQNPPKLNEALIIDEENQSNGCSLYFGKSNGAHKSDRELCIYDKKAERLFHKDDLNIDYYVRYEMRFRNELSDEVVYYLINEESERLENYDIGVFAKNQLFRMLKLKHPYYNGKKTKIENVSMWDVLPAWDKFLDYVEGVKFTQRPKIEPTIEIKREWQKKAITKQDIIFELADLDVQKIDEWVEPGFEELCNKLINRLDWFNEHEISKHEIEMINNYRKSKYGYNCRTLTKQDIDNYRKELMERIKKLKADYLLPW